MANAACTWWLVNAFRSRDVMLNLTCALAATMINCLTGLNLFNSVLKYEQ